VEPEEVRELVAGRGRGRPEAVVAPEHVDEQTREVVTSAVVEIRQRADVRARRPM